MSDVTVSVWLPREQWLNPCGKGSHGHIALEIPATHQYPDTYVSLYDKDQFRRKDADAGKPGYHLREITVPLNDADIDKMHLFLRNAYGNSMDHGEYHTPPSGGNAVQNFCYATCPCLPYHNCTSIAIALLEEGGVSLPIGPGYSFSTFLLNVVTGAETGYCIGALIDLCKNCEFDKTAEKFGIAEVSVSLGFALCFLCLYVLSVFRAEGIPILSHCQRSVNPFFGISLTSFILNSILTGVAGYYHYKAVEQKAFDNPELIGTGIGAGVAALFFVGFALLTVYQDSFNYIIRPTALRTALLKKDYQEADPERVDEEATRLVQ